MTWLLGDSHHLWEAVVKAVLMYAVALAGLRLADRRTLAQWTAVDFVAAVALGAVVGRTAVASTESFATGAVVLVALLLAHRVAVQLRFVRALRPVFEHPVRVLVDGTRVHDRELRRCGLTRDDLDAALRQRGVVSLHEVRYVLYESKGGLSIVAAAQTGPTELLDPVLDPARDERGGEATRRGWVGRCRARGHRADGG